MAKIRTVKPELFRHEELFEAEKKSSLPLRLIFIGLFTAVDRDGRFRWKPKQLKLDIMPYDDIDFEIALNILAEASFIKKYEKEGQFYGYIPTWKKHQTVNKHEPLSRLPDPATCKIVYLCALQSVNDSLKDTSSEQNPIAQLCTCMHMQCTSESVQDTNQTMQSLIQTVQCTQIHMLAPLEMEMEEEMEVELERDVELELEREMEVEINKKIIKKSESENEHNVSPTHDDILHVFEYWKRVMDHPKAVLDYKRRNNIKAALMMGYSLETLCTAIDGCKLTPHNMGQNDRGERFDGLHVIFKSADQIDRFINNAKSPPRPLNKSEQRVHENINASEAWLKQQLQEDYHA